MGQVYVDGCYYSYENNDKVSEGHEAWHARACVSVVCTCVARRCRRGRRRLTIGSHGRFVCFSYYFASFLRLICLNCVIFYSAAPYGAALLVSTREKRKKCFQEVLKY